MHTHYYLLTLLIFYKVKENETTPMEENEVTEPLIKIKKKKSKKASLKPDQIDPAESTSIMEVKANSDVKQAMKLNMDVKTTLKT